MAQKSIQSGTKGVYFNETITNRLNKLRGRRFKVPHVDADGKTYTQNYVVPHGPTEYARDSMLQFFEILENAEEVTE